jgi:hypothetical protein
MNRSQLDDLIERRKRGLPYDDALIDEALEFVGEQEPERDAPYHNDIELENEELRDAIAALPDRCANCEDIREAGRAAGGPIKPGSAADLAEEDCVRCKPLRVAKGLL